MASDKTWPLPGPNAYKCQGCQFWHGDEEAVPDDGEWAAGCDDG